MSGTEQLQIGRVVKPHGVRGELVVEPTTDDPEGRFAVGTVLTGRQRGKERTLTVTATRPHQGRLLVTVAEVSDRTEADTLRGLRFFGDPVIDPDEEAYYDHQLEGLRVLDCGQVDEETANARAYEGESPEPVDIGVVSGVTHGPAGTLLEVAVDADAPLATAGSTVLVPFRRAIVPIVDLDNGALVLTPPEGLLELG
ncbi:ribosome maturation factor RimM [Corynebacterium kalidii]|jgi:16S rRNA processing protein RimM|uniref:Ribosome maturation factor RimM n=1 Tax=Corynebacterium kalidii TaxID=2931982 RepID=A0A9X1WLB8_9CORY|nr:ribosome maturation factor RimM [Corynebacterium kalidii]MCJ7859435.1 ribosome maturation factor RimM [Corynebacterium kalidii]